VSELGIIPVRATQIAAPLQGSILAASLVPRARAYGNEMSVKVMRCAPRSDVLDHRSNGLFKLCEKYISNNDIVLTHVKFNVIRISY
jgi:hypothetical protein